MKNLKRKILIKSVVLITLSFFTLTSCSQKSMTGIAITQDGYSILNNIVYYIDSGTLKYLDAKTGQSGVLCSKPNCKHELYDEKENPDPICNAVFKGDGSIDNCINVGEKIYYTAEHAMNFLIYEYDYKNDKCEKVAEVENLSPYENIVYLNGNIYFNCNSWVFHDNGVDDGLGWKTGESQVCKYNIKEKSVDLLFKGMDLYIQKIYPANNSLYACCYEPFSGDGRKQRSTYVYDEEKYKKVSDVGYYYYDDNNGYVNPLLPNATSDRQMSKKIMKYNFKTQEEEELCTGIVAYAYSHYMIYLGNDGKHYKYDSDKNKTEEMKYDINYIIVYIDKDYIIYSDQTDENDPKDYILNTEEFYNENYEKARLIEKN